MTHDTRTADDIERDIENERAQMSDTINDLQQKFSLDAITDDLGHMVRDLSDDFGRTISRTVGRNPAAMVVVGAGLAWLVLGANRNVSGSHGAARASRPRNFAQRGGTPDQFAPDDEDSWFDDGQVRRSRQDQGTTHSNANPDGATGMMERARHAVSDTAEGIGDKASDLADRVSHGLEDLSDTAKARVISARRAAHDARAASEAAMNRGTAAAKDMFRDQPLVAGALAMAFGAAVGGMLSHTRLEDDTLGAHSDQLFRDAQDVYREERDRAIAVVKGVARDVRDEFSDIGSDLKSEAHAVMPDDKSVADVVVDRASEASKRVYDSAKDNAAASQHDSHKT
ncbi:uncharacterized protein DUF3618 [Roseinatronobacter thiooxidans]|uniref:Uncharacterized protein DUF3618 n=1 Tax=Roseinatronobacter thiooxidans TaxID=121821 RepID=A0A2W7QHF9_9RHOB|nr:DUF3618 domain-containing protein [Roseinatronobacter thiooxidans]PZX38025.1 uncharacterized protein DUF3618 [Roseinatronobacter thiooxidans]